MTVLIKHAAVAATRVPVLDRFMTKVDKREDGCWHWTAAKFSKGYGTFRIEGRSRSAHRVVYELLVGPIPDGMTLDHLCRTRGCVNPEHLEPVTNLENIRRGVEARTRCPNGHPYDDNTYRWPKDPYRSCNECRNERQRRYRAKRKAA